MAIKVGMVSLGCSKNLVDSERMLFKLKKHGYKLVTEPGLADAAVVNTCGFIQSAKEEAIETILELAKLTEEGTLKKIIITGCLTERYREEAAELFPEADAVVGIGNTKDIVDILDTFSQAKELWISLRSLMLNSQAKESYQLCRSLHTSKSQRDAQTAVLTALYL